MRVKLQNKQETTEEAQAESWQDCFVTHACSLFQLPAGKHLEVSCLNLSRPTPQDQDRDLLILKRKPSGVQGRKRRKAKEKKKHEEVRGTEMSMWWSEWN